LISIKEDPPVPPSKSRSISRLDPKAAIAKEPVRDKSSKNLIKVASKKDPVKDEQAKKADTQKFKDSSISSISNRLSEVKMQNEDIEKRLNDLQKRKEVCQGNRKLKIEKTDKLISPRERESRTDRSKEKASPKWEVAEVSVQPLPIQQAKSRKQSPSNPPKDQLREQKQVNGPAIKVKPKPQPTEQPKNAKQEMAEQYKREKKQLKEEAEKQKERELEQQKKKKLLVELDREEIRQAKMIKKIDIEMNKASEEMRRLLEMKKKAEENLQQISQ